MEFTQPVKRCPKGHIIPDGDNPMDKDGKPLAIKDKRTGEMVLAPRTKPMIGCPICAKEVEVPAGVARLSNPPARLAKGEVVDEQTTIREITGPIPMLHL
jgi:hypothetical protein